MGVRELVGDAKGCQQVKRLRTTALKHVRNNGADLRGITTGQHKTSQVQEFVSFLFVS